MVENVKAYSDIFIKYLLGSVNNKDILLSFVNRFLARVGFDKAVDVQVENPFNVKNFVTDKFSIVDVKVTDEKNRIYNIEVQVDGNEDFIKRSLYYWSRFYSLQLAEAEEYPVLKPVICINVLNFELKNTKSYFNTYLLKEMKTNDILTDHIVLSFIELPKLDKIVSNDVFDKFCYFLKTEGTEDNMLKVILDEDPILHKSHEQYTKFNQNKELRDLYEARLKAERDQRYHISIAEKRGLEKGKEEGLEKGKEENKIETAIKMYQDKLSLELISKYTGLSIQEIHQLIDKK